MIGNRQLATDCQEFPMQDGAGHSPLLLAHGELSRGSTLQEHRPIQGYSRQLKHMDREDVLQRLGTLIENAGNESYVCRMSAFCNPPTAP